MSVLFADLQGFTAFSARTKPEDVARMLNEYFAQTLPPGPRHGGEVDKLIGDAIMATFNTKGDQPEHALAAVRAAVELQRAADAVSSAHPDWPRFRVGVNSGTARVGILEAREKREYTTVGDIVNLASRLEGPAEPGQVVVGGATYRALPDGTKVEPLGGVRVKGKEAPVGAYLVLDLPGTRREGRERLQHDGREPEEESELR